MLPFMKPKHTGGLIVTQRKADGGDIEKHDDSDTDGLGACAADLIRAVHAKDEAGVAAAMRAAFEILDSAPHDEGPHTNEQE